MDEYQKLKSQYKKGKKFFERNRQLIKSPVYNRFEEQVLAPQDALYRKENPDILDEVKPVEKLFGGYIVGVVNLKEKEEVQKKQQEEKLKKPNKNAKSEKVKPFIYNKFVSQHKRG